MKTRLFIGNLASTVTEADLRDKFGALLSSHKDQVTLGNVEVRCKNEDHYFGYVDVVHVKKEGSWSKDKDAKQSDHNPPPFIRKCKFIFCFCCSHFIGTFWFPTPGCEQKHRSCIIKFSKL